MKLESVVIVKNDYGYVASIRYSDRFCDQDISSTSKFMIYTMVENHIRATLENQK